MYKISVYGCAIFKKRDAIFKKLVCQWVKNCRKETELWMWIGFTSLETGTHGGLLWMLNWTFSFN